MKVHRFIERAAVRSGFLSIMLMVDGHLFEMIASIATRLRKKTDGPFGGIQVRQVIVMASVNGDNIVLQLVITGDFFQLPPVTKAGGHPFFAFECDAWKAYITVTLTQVFRQKDSSTYSLHVLGQRARTESTGFVQLLNDCTRFHQATRDTVFSRAFPPDRIK